VTSTPSSRAPTRTWPSSKRRSSDNEFIDPDEARALAAASATLLQATANDPNPNRRQLAWAAVRYFECPDDGDNDFVIGGLDDDAAVMNAVAAYLDLPHCTVAWT
jgi:hypothetical protein